MMFFCVQLLLITVALLSTKLFVMDAIPVHRSQPSFDGTDHTLLSLAKRIQNESENEYLMDSKDQEKNVTFVATINVTTIVRLRNGNRSDKDASRNPVSLPTNTWSFVSFVDLTSSKAALYSVIRYGSSIIAGAAAAVDSYGSKAAVVVKQRGEKFIRT